MGDSYSEVGAAAFVRAASDKGINVCRTSSYQPNSADMETAISRIVQDGCCGLTVIFAQPKDIVSILLEAHKQHYAGEWLMGETAVDSYANIIAGLKEHVGTTSQVYQLMRGKYELTALLYGPGVLIS